MVREYLLVDVWNKKINSFLLFSCSVMSDFLWPRGLQHTSGFPVLHNLGVFSNSSVESMMPANRLILCHPLLLLPLVFPSIRVFSNEPVLRISDQTIGVSASAPVLPMNIQDWFPLGWTVDRLTVQGTLKILLQHHSSKASILWCSTFFMVQLYMWLWENHRFN